MKLKFLLAALAVLLVGIGVMRVPAYADWREHEERVHRLHHECERGDRHACVNFGVLIGENRQYHGEWRRAHPEWWWWERR